MSRIRAGGVAVAVAAACLARSGRLHSETTDPHAAAAALVAQLEGGPRAALVVDPVGQARAALERATRMRTTGDEVHARAADELALEWAKTAADLVKATEIEAAAAAALRQRSVDAQAHLERTRAAVEEGIARVGRLQAELQRRGAGRPARRRRAAVEVHDKGSRPARRQGGGKKGAVGTSSGDAP